MTDVAGELDPSFELVLRRHLPDVSVDGRLSRDDELASFGADSMALIELMMVLEAEYAIVFTDDLLTPETFKTVGSLANAVARLR